MKEAEQKYGPLFEKYRSQDIRSVAENTDAVKMGRRLYLTYCTNCHGSDAGGGPGGGQSGHGHRERGGDEEPMEVSPDQVIVL